MLSLWPLEQFIFFKFEYSNIRRLNLPVLPYLIGESLLYPLVLTVTPGKLVFLHDTRFRLFSPLECLYRIVYYITRPGSYPRQIQSISFTAFPCISDYYYSKLCVYYTYCHGALSPAGCFVMSGHFSDISENVSVNGRPTGHGHALQTLISLERDDQFTSGLLCPMPPSNQFRI